MSNNEVYNHVNPQPTRPSLGLTGWAATAANLSAVGLIAVMFFQGQQEQFKTAREDRELFRRALGQLKATNDRQWQAILANQEAVTELADSVKDLTAEIRRRKGGSEESQPKEEKR